MYKSFDEFKIYLQLRLSKTSEVKSTDQCDSFLLNNCIVLQCDCISEKMRVRSIIIVSIYFQLALAYRLTVTGLGRNPNRDTFKEYLGLRGEFLTNKWKQFFNAVIGDETDFRRFVNARTVCTQDGC